MTTSRQTPHTLTAGELAHLAGLTTIHTDMPTLRAHARDSSRAVPAGLPAAVVVPASVEEVAETLKWANDRRVPVSVRGAGTGLSGGAVAYSGGIVVSLAALTRLDIDAENMTATAGAGVVTSHLDETARPYGLMYAPDPVSSKWSTIGGNIATNAGGPRCLAHGVTGDVVMALEVVLADGRIVRTGSRTVKNSTGYNLTGLFVGSEGTLGIITEAVVRLDPRPTGHPVAFAAAFSDLGDAGRAVAAVLSQCPRPESLELMDSNTIGVVAEHFPDEDTPAGAAVIVGEYVGPHAAENASRLLAVCRQHEAETLTGPRAANLLRTRKRVNPALSASGLTASCDVAVPITRLADILRNIDSLSQAFGMQVNTFAHAGDGNLHPAVVVPNGDERALEIAEDLLDAITQTALDMGGVISGEHGIGSLKLHHLDAQYDPATRSLQREIKALVDPNTILTPGRAV
jgi:glycolate oxidase